MLVGKVKSLTLEWNTFLVLPSGIHQLTLKHYTRLERPSMDKHSSLLQTLQITAEKKFLTFCPGVNATILFPSSSLICNKNKLERLSLPCFLGKSNFASKVRPYQ